jgi:hypothetical protein
MSAGRVLSLGLFAVLLCGCGQAARAHSATPEPTCTYQILLTHQGDPPPPTDKRALQEAIDAGRVHVLDVQTGACP